MNAAELAELIAEYFEATGYPFLGKPEVRSAPPEVYPLVVIWDDSAEITRVIACCADGEFSQVQDALHYAETMAAVMEVEGEAPCGTACHAAWPGGFINSQE